MRLYDYDASCNCYKVRLLLAHLGIEYERVPVDIFAGGTLTDEFARINPMRTVPVLETEDGYLPESNAILVYLSSGTPLSAGRPVGARAGHALADLRADGRRVHDRRPAFPAARRSLDAGSSRGRKAARRRARSAAAAGRPPGRPRVPRRRPVHDRRHRRVRVLAPSARRPGSTWSRIRASAPGSRASSRNQASWRTSSRTARTPRPARGSRSTAEGRALSAPGRGGRADTRHASARRRRRRGRPSG